MSLIFSLSGSFLIKEEFLNPSITTIFFLLTWKLIYINIHRKHEDETDLDLLIILKHNCQSKSKKVL